MNLSVCMIVKNEEAVLKQSLESICAHVDDIIIVDTGSTDHTKEIALAFTQQVYDFSWCDDFSAARNYSLGQALHDWVLVLDADEVLTCFDMELIENMIQQDQDIVGRIKITNILVDAMGEKRHNERISRLFNRKYFHYEGIIHEQVVRLDGLPYATTPVSISADHMGYIQQVIVRTDKIIRNISLLEKALQKSPKDDYFLYQLGKSYFMAEKFQEAVVYFKQALEALPNFALEYAEDLVETYGYALLNSGAYSEAMSLENYTKYYDYSTDYLFLLGLIYMNNGAFSRAAEYFLRCLGNKEGKIVGINSYLPAYNVAVIHECLGQVTEATYYYKKCGDYPVALERIKILNKQ